MNFVDVAEIRAHLESNVTLFPPKPARFKRERFADIEPNTAEWLVKHFLPAKGVGILAGPSTVGKSFVILYMCLRIAMGRTILSHRARKAGILYIAAEGQNGMRKRIKALRDKFSIETEAFHFIGQAPNLLDAEDMLALTAEAEAASREMLERAGVELGLIIIDTTAASMPGADENAGKDMSVALSNAQKLSDASGALVLLIGHTGKNEDLGVRGWSGQIGNSDVIIYLTKDRDDPALRLGTVHKLKDGPDGERFAYRLKDILMGYDADGDTITSAYPVFEEPPVEGGKRKAKSELPAGPKLILRALKIMVDEGQGEIVPPVPGVPVGTRGVHRELLRERVIRMGYADEDDKPDTTKRLINRDIQALAAALKIRVEGKLVWPL